MRAIGVIFLTLLSQNLPRPGIAFPAVVNPEILFGVF